MTSTLPSRTRTAPSGRSRWTLAKKRSRPSATDRGEAAREREPVGDQSQGVQLATVENLADYSASECDWRRCEAILNTLEHFVTKTRMRLLWQGTVSIEGLRLGRWWPWGSDPWSNTRGGMYRGIGDAAPAPTRSLPLMARLWQEGAVGIAMTPASTPKSPRPPCAPRNSNRSKTIPGIHPWETPDVMPHEHRLFVRPVRRQRVCGNASIVARARAIPRRGGGSSTSRADRSDWCPHLCRSALRLS